MSRQSLVAHAEFARGQEENWTVISDAQKRKRVQNRLAQRSYRHKVRERLQELEKLKTGERGNGGLTAGAPAHKATGTTRRANVDCNASVGNSTTVNNGTIAPALTFSRSTTETSESSIESIQCFQGFDDSPFSPLASPHEEKGEPNDLDDFLAGLCSVDSTEAPDALVSTTSGNAQIYPASSSSESADYGFELFGEPSPSVATTQRSELRFTELMLKIRDVGFVDMESMILEYYSTQFRRESLPYWLQRRSRQQNLCRLLEQLHMHSGSWPAEECAAFQTGIKVIAQRLSSMESPSSDAMLSFPFPVSNGLA